MRQTRCGRCGVRGAGGGARYDFIYVVDLIMIVML